MSLKSSEIQHLTIHQLQTSEYHSRKSTRHNHVKSRRKTTNADEN